MMEVPYHYQFRVIVIGDTMVGKSSLLKTFSDGSFGQMEPTVGVDFFSKIIAIKPRRQISTSNSRRQTDRCGDNIFIKLQIWDTAGQERFKSIVTSYYRNSIGIILVYDVTNRESYSHLIDWFTEARRHVEPNQQILIPKTMSRNQYNYPISSTPTSSLNTISTSINDCDNFSMSFSNRFTNDESNVSFNSISGSNYRPDQANSRMTYLVLGCKIDLESKREVSNEEGKAFADKYGFKFIETSSKTHHNVNQAFQLLAEEIYDKISELGRLNRLHMTASGGHLTFDSTSSFHNEGVRLGPLIENSRNFSDSNGLRLLEAQPVSGYLGGCC